MMALFTFIVFSASLLSPRAALAFGIVDVESSFEDEEIERLFVEVDGSNDCEYLMCTYENNSKTVKRLRVRDEYRERYDSLVNDSVSILSDSTADSSDTIFDDRPLEQISPTSSFPWRDLLMLQVFSAQGSFNGSAFLVGKQIAVTAAHCLTENGDFSDSIYAYSDYQNSGLSNRIGVAKIAIVPVEWAEGDASGDEERFEYDFGIVVFQDPIPGTSQSGDFLHESIPVADSLGMRVNCAGWLKDYGETSGFYAWHNERDGGISLIDNLGNAFHVDLSCTHGMSGGPVYYQAGHRYIVVGIISHEHTALDQWNYAMRITESCEFLIAWANAGGCGHISPTDGISPFTGPSAECPTVGQAVGQARLQLTDPADIPRALRRAKRTNPDIVAWLYVPGTGVNEPVARGPVSDFYLDHDWKGQKSPIGCPYVSPDGGRLFSSPVTVVYGHSFASGSLALTTLHALEDRAFFSSQDRAYVYLPDKRLEYRVASALLFKAKAIEDVEQGDPADLASYFSELSNPDPRRFVGLKRRIELDPASDKILQLSTCTAPVADPAHRFVVTCVLVGEEEL